MENTTLKSTKSPSSASRNDRGEALGSSIGMKLLAFTLKALPSWVAYLMASIPVIWYYAIRGKGQKAAASLHRRLGLKGGRVRRFLFGYAQARAFSRIIIDNMYLGAFGPGRFEIEEKGTEIFKEVLARKKGLVLLSAHMGNWHLAVNFLWNIGAHVHLVIDDVRQEEVRRQMDLAKDRSAHLTVHGVKGDASLVFTLSQVLRRNEVVIMAGDRASAESRRVKIPFLGEEAWFPAAGLSLAAAVDAPVCAALTFRKGTRKYICHGIGPFGATCDQPDKTARIEAMAREFAHHLETFIQRYPTQWFNFFDFWKER